MKDITEIIKSKAHSFSVQSKRPRGTGRNDYGQGLQGMNSNPDLIFELFRDIFSVKTTDITELMPSKAEQLEEVMK